MLVIGEPILRGCLRCLRRGTEFQIGYPLNMMRLGWRSDRAVDVLLIDEPANFYNGVGGKFEEDRNMPCSLPGNGGFLTIAMMAGGFTGPDGKPRTVGFPPAWQARAEVFQPFP